MNAPVDRAALAAASLDDKYTLERGRVFLTGMQALVRLPMLQRERDRARRASTPPASSPAIAARRSAASTRRCGARRSTSRATTSCSSPASTRTSPPPRSGARSRSNLFPKASYDGVFGIWYGKGPGVDRCGDVFKHANVAGTSQHGGVLALAGDDHVAKSSTLPHQTDHIFKACLIPVLNPSSVQDNLDLGLHGFAMSRFSGCWIAFKASRTWWSPALGRSSIPTA